MWLNPLTLLGCQLFKEYKIHELNPYIYIYTLDDLDVSYVTWCSYLKTTHYHLFSLSEMWHLFLQYIIYDCAFRQASYSTSWKRPRHSKIFRHLKSMINLHCLTYSYEQCNIYNMYRNHAIIQGNLFKKKETCWLQTCFTPIFISTHLKHKKKNHRKRCQRKRKRTKKNKYTKLHQNFHIFVIFFPPLKRPHRLSVFSNFRVLVKVHSTKPSKGSELSPLKSKLQLPKGWMETNGVATKKNEHCKAIWTICLFFNCFLIVFGLFLFLFVNIWT